MTSRSSILSLVLAMALFVGACASDEPAVEGDSSDSTASTAAAEEDTVTTVAGSDDVEEPAEPGGGSEGATDGSDIDWATVDLTTIDWANLDMRTIDLEAIRSNPTAENLTEEAQSIIAARLNPGSVTLIIGDKTWEFDDFLCAVGLEATESDVYSFTTNTFGDIDGTRVQIQATIRDDSGQGRLEGDDLVYEVQIDDITDFDNPAIQWRIVPDQGIVIDGYEMTAEGTFDDRLTPEAEAIPGSLVGTCGDMSRIP